MKKCGKSQKYKTGHKHKCVLEIRHLGWCICGCGLTMIPPVPQER
jgi:hypothetical protein